MTVFNERVRFDAYYSDTHFFYSERFIAHRESSVYDKILYSPKIV